MSEVSDDVRAAAPVNGPAGASVRGRSAPVVTLFESYGSGAAAIGRAVAAALGVPFHEQAFSSQQLEESARQREKEGLLTRMFDAMGSMPRSAEWTSATSPAPSGTATTSSCRTPPRSQQWARAGGVIVGRNGAFILADRPGALHVMLDGPLEQRIVRAAQEAGISQERAARRQKNEDRVRADMSIKLYGWDPRDPARYDLVVNTGRMDPDTCVDIIVNACRSKTAHRDR